MSHDRKPKQRYLNEALSKEYRQIDEMRRANRIAIIAILLSTLLSLASILIGMGAQRRASRAEETVELSRVETGVVATNIIGKTLDSTWRPWVKPLSEWTTYVGVEREVPFANKFRHVPSVGASMNVINTYPIKNLFPGSEAAQFKERTREHINDIHIVAFADHPSQSDFKVQIGIGLPTEAANILISRLETNMPDPKLVEYTRQSQFLPPDTVTLTDHEKWALNFADLVGTVNVLWIAQAEEGLKPSVGK
jgi:hypothetical protein